MRKVNYLTSLTSLRGIAALLVIIFHFDLIFFNLAVPRSPFFVRKGYLWVDFFFLLSGFIMMHVYGNTFSRDFKVGDFGNFIRARFARIYPLHLFSFLTVIAFYFWYSSYNIMNEMDVFTFNMKAIPTNLLLLQSMDFHRYLSWNTPSWSVSTEWWMYFLFPFILIPFEKLKKKYVFFFLTAGYLFVIYFLHPLSNKFSPFPNVTGIYSLDVTYDYGFIRCLLGFVFGMFLYKLYQARWGYSYFSKNSVFLIILFTLIIFLSFNTSDFIPVVLLGMIILASTYAVGTAKKILNLKFLKYLGDISYSIYLMHMPILFFLLSTKNYLSTFNNSFFIAWFFCFVYVVIVLTISTFTYILVEVPMRSKIKDFRVSAYPINNIVLEKNESDNLK